MEANCKECVHVEGLKRTIREEVKDAVSEVITPEHIKYIEHMQLLVPMGSEDSRERAKNMFSTLAGLHKNLERVGHRTIDSLVKALVAILLAGLAIAYFYNKQ